MLAWLTPSIVTSKVIQNAHYAPMMCVQLLKLPIGTHKLYFATENPHKFHQCRFYSFLASLGTPSFFINKYQAQHYALACQQLSQFRSIYQLVCKIEEFNDQLRYLYNICQKNVAQSNFFSKSQQSTKIYEEDVKDALDRYIVLIDSLQQYPQWQQKITQQVGKWFHLIHTNLEDGHTKQQIFSKMNRQTYFI